MSGVARCAGCLVGVVFIAAEQQRQADGDGGEDHERHDARLEQRQEIADAGVAVRLEDWRYTSLAELSVDNTYLSLRSGMTATAVITRWVRPDSAESVSMACAASVTSKEHT